MALPVLPPDAGSPHRTAVTEWDRLWVGAYNYDGSGTEYSACVVTRSTPPTPPPVTHGRSRGWWRVCSNGKSPSYEPDLASPPVSGSELSELMHEAVSKACRVRHGVGAAGV